MNKLWIDDLRLPPEGWDWAKSSHEAIDLIDNYNGGYETISFDHDLGGEDTGMLVLNWMANDLPAERWPSRILVHSYNPIGAKHLFDLAVLYKPEGTTVQRATLKE